MRGGVTAIRGRCFPGERDKAISLRMYVCIQYALERGQPLHKSEVKLKQAAPG